MAWVKHNFQCNSCEYAFDEMYKRGQLREVECPECGSNDLIKLLSAPNIAAFSIMSPEHQRDSLMKRSAKHTQAQIDKEPERWGEAGKARATKKIQG